MVDIDTSFIEAQEVIVPQLQGGFTVDEIEEVEDKEELDTSEIFAIKKVTTEELLKGYDLALALDPSQNGSGFALIDNRQESKLTLASSSLTYDDKDTDPLRYFKMQQEYAQDLLTFIQEETKETTPTFDLIIIEDTLLKHNPQIYKRLILINNVIDYLIGTGQVKTKQFLRVNNEIWKKELRSYKLGKKYKNDKLDVEESLLLLELPYALTYHTQPKAWKEKNNYQDKLDAIGMLIAGVTLKEQKETKTVKKKLKKVAYKMVLTPPAKDLGYTTMKVKNPSKRIEEVLKMIRQETEDNKYCIPFTSLGVWGIKQKIFVPDGHYVAYLLVEGV